MHYALITQTYQKPFVYTSMSFIHDLFYPEKILFYTDYISFPTIVFKFLFTGLSFTFLLYKFQILSKILLYPWETFISSHIYFLKSWKPMIDLLLNDWPSTNTLFYNYSSRIEDSQIHLTILYLKHLMMLVI